MAYDENIRIIAEELERLKNRPTGDTLPEVETTDEGKVLTVNSSGKWDAEELPDQLPSVEATDEGKVLTVNSSGEWAAADPSSSYDLDYSTTEKNTGKKWIDGSDIYSKTYHITSPLTDNTNNKIDSDYLIASFHTIRAYATCLLNDGVNELIAPYINLNASPNQCISIFVSDGLYVSVKGLNIAEAWVTIEYTKKSTSKKKGAK